MESTGTIVVHAPIRESMIEDYVLHLQRTMNLSNERTRQLMSFFLLQYMLKNINPQDFVVQNHRITQFDGFSVPSVEPTYSRTSLPNGNSRKFMVTPVDREDLLEIDFDQIIRLSPPSLKESSTASQRTSTTSFDMWSRYIDHLRSTKSGTGSMASFP